MSEKWELNHIEDNIYAVVIDGVVSFSGPIIYVAKWMELSHNEAIDQLTEAPCDCQDKPDGCTVLPQSVADEHTAEVNSAFNDGAILGMEEGRKEAMFWIQFGPPLPEVPVK